MSTRTNIWRRIGYAISFLIVAGVAAYVSYGHIAEVARLAHQPEGLAKVLPLSVDGLMLIATLAMAEDKAGNRMPRGWARVAFWIGAAVSVAANIASTLVHYGPEPLALAVAGWAPIALLLAIEVVARPGKPKPVPAVTDPIAEDIKADDAAVPVSPAPAGSSQVEVPARVYSERHERRLRTGK